MPAPTDAPRSSDGPPVHRPELAAALAHAPLAAAWWKLHKVEGAL
jgi:hypothetical protein